MLLNINVHKKIIRIRRKKMNDKLLTAKDLTKIFSVSRSTIYRWMESEEFPRGKQLASNTVRWLESEVLAWQEEALGKC
ncbi:helix-turn-helix transcriptional regulator [Methylophaga sp. OBS3]|uniref:helix-turn-helix transcriptional regulator n=1 Tax=Methylophaga sp. OBS3 TaxID=2991934 RepID=UPI00224EC593|nr:AlpA family phage regulatory protein [Methylophaga sp. OBS3]MCX4190824.1 AlpA family phage regulatory protein [Methylophaga sp. OBS3]